MSLLRPIAGSLQVDLEEGSIGAARSMLRARSIMGRRFSRGSVRREVKTLRCPRCHTLISLDVYVDHISKCEGAPEAKPEVAETR
ncbi:MAG: hypothetical protein V1857_05820 [archaeon]